MAKFATFQYMYNCFPERNCNYIVQKIITFSVFIENVKFILDVGDGSQQPNVSCFTLHPVRREHHEQVNHHRSPLNYDVSLESGPS